MNPERITQVLRAPRVSEKATLLADAHRQHVFQVAPGATRDEIREAVETLFDVKVARVNVMNVRGKRKGFGKRRGRRRDWKKAYVMLREGHDIQLGGSE